MAVTIKDVAALAGVSPSTVSRTCKNNPSISEETKERVRKAMIELGYEPNFQASNLASQNSRTIGIILPASRSGKVDGFIVLYSKKEDPVIDYLFNEGLLYILIGKATQYTNQTIYIDNDNLLAGREATEYLYQLGHRRIAYLGSDSSLMFSADRKAGYQLALASHQLPVRPEYCAEVKNASENNEEAIRGLLLQEDRPTAILVSDDILAVSLERVCLETHLSIPEDLSIISFNNSLFARLTSPQLTSIDIGAGQLGSEAASQIINHIENPNLPATKIIVPHHLIERDSCCKV